MDNETKKTFPRWEQLYKETGPVEMPWYWRDLEPDVREAPLDHEIHRGRVLDLGTGPGTQALGLAALEFEVTATDVARR